MRYLFIVAGLVWLTGSAAFVRADVFSDDFSVSQSSSTNDASSGFDAGTSSATSNGVRNLFTDIFTNTAPGDARARTAIDNGDLTLSSDEEVSALGVASYQLATPIDLSTTPDFEFVILSNDVAGSMFFQISDGTTHNQFFVTLPVITSFDAPFTFLVTPNYTGIDPTHITQIDFGPGGTFGEDVSIDSVVTVPIPVSPAPEPGTLGLLALGFAALGLLAARLRGFRVPNAEASAL